MKRQRNLSSLTCALSIISLDVRSGALAGHLHEWGPEDSHNAL